MKILSNKAQFNLLKSFLNFEKKRFNRHYSSVNNLLIRNDFIVVNDTVKEALDKNKPVVALESTIITHGLPYPNNYETALEVERIIRDSNAIPATIAFIKGKIYVGLTNSEIEQISKATDQQNSVKLSRRDLSYIFSTPQNDKLIGGTTVSATMIAAEAANIPIFVTGGIGGVHRDFTESMDVSADLIELARTRVAVISSGIKSILDIGKTLEYLETFGVCVSVLNENGSSEFPAFFTSKSGHHAPYNLRTISDAASLIHTHLRTGLNSGLLIGVPIPEQHSINSEYIEKTINEALDEAKKLNIKGKAITPFLLEKINKLTKGKSLGSNIELIKNNAKIGAEIANKLCVLKQRDNESVQSSTPSLSSTTKTYGAQNCGSSTDIVTLVGGVNIDFTFKLHDDKTINYKGVTQPCTFHQCLGGVARNMTESLIRYGLNKSILISAISNDLVGNYIVEKSKSIGFDTSKWLMLDNVDHTSTGSYCSLFDTHGELLLGLGAMDAHSFIIPKLVEKNLDNLYKSSIVIVDADVPVETLRYIVGICYDAKIPIWYNPTDLRKCMKIIDAKSLSKLTYISPNSKELFTIFAHIFQHPTTLDDRITEYEIKQKLSEHELKNLNRIIKRYKTNLDNIEINDLKSILKYLLIYVPFIVLSRGSNDLILASSSKLSLYKRKQLPLKKNFQKINDWSPQLHYFPVIQLNSNETVVNVSGAGDNTSAGIIAGVLRDYDLVSTIYCGLLAAKYTLLTHENVSSRISNINSNLIHEISYQYTKEIKVECL